MITKNANILVAAGFMRSPNDDVMRSSLRVEVIHFKLLSPIITCRSLLQTARLRKFFLFFQIYILKDPKKSLIDKTVEKLFQALANGSVVKNRTRIRKGEVSVSCRCKLR